MKQHRLGLCMTAKRARRREFLFEMEKVVPWADLVAMVSPFFIQDGKRGRPPFPSEAMLRVRFLQQWFAPSDPAMEKADHARPLFREFAKLEFWDEGLPEESTNLRFRHVL